MAYEHCRRTIYKGMMVFGVICLVIAGGLYWTKDDPDEESESAAENTLNLNDPTVHKSDEAVLPQKLTLSDAWMAFTKYPNVENATRLLDESRKRPIFDDFVQIDEEKKKEISYFVGDLERNEDFGRKIVKKIEKEYSKHYEDPGEIDLSRDLAYNTIVRFSYPTDTLSYFLLACKGEHDGQCPDFYYDLGDEFRMNAGVLAFIFSFLRITEFVDRFGRNNAWDPISLLKRIINIIRISTEIMTKRPDSFDFSFYENDINKLTDIFFNRKLFAENSAFRRDIFFAKKILDSQYFFREILGFFTYESTSVPLKRTYQISTNQYLTYFTIENIKKRKINWVLVHKPFRDVVPPAILIIYLPPDKLQEYRTKKIECFASFGKIYYIRAIVAQKKDDNPAFFSKTGFCDWFNFNDLKNDVLTRDEMLNFLCFHSDYKRDVFLFFEKSEDVEKDVMQPFPLIF